MNYLVGANKFDQYLIKLFKVCANTYRYAIKMNFCKRYILLRENILLASLNEMIELLKNSCLLANNALILKLITIN